MLIHAVIFDMDGLMLDTEPLYRAAWQQASADCGYTLSNTLYAQLAGQRRADAEALLQDKFGPRFRSIYFASLAKGSKPPYSRAVFCKKRTAWTRL
jgi:beta-phosphoglucomutase-like phosphatase (HAD superfamily)